MQHKDAEKLMIWSYRGLRLNVVYQLKGSYDAISSFPFSLECYKLIVHR